MSEIVSLHNHLESVEKSHGILETYLQKIPKTREAGQSAPAKP
jgi:hypothetical protein